MDAATLIGVHAAVGAVALVLGLAALAAPKRRGAHPKLGRGYLLALGLALLLAAPVMVASGNLFLMGIGLLVVAHGAVAWGAARWRPAGPLPVAARAAAGAAGLVFAVFAAWGAWLGVTEGQPLGWVCVGMAAIGGVLVRKVLTWQGGPWRDLHVHGAAGALISSVTAFAAVTEPRYANWLPEIVLWMGPSAVLTPVFMRMGRRAG